MKQKVAIVTASIAFLTRELALPFIVGIRGFSQLCLLRLLFGGEEPNIFPYYLAKQKKTFYN
jgi:hypothetical protein